MNRNYRLTARAHSFVVDTARGDDLARFPIEKAPFSSIWYFICATGIPTAGCGWELVAKTEVQGPVHASN